MKILLLVQQNSRCIELLKQEIRNKLTQGDSLHVWEINKVSFSNDQSLIYDGREQLSVNDISLVVKRTWGPIRERGLSICRILEGAGVKILNGCDFIAWTHSKLQQYSTIARDGKAHLFPKTVCVPAEQIDGLIGQIDLSNLAQSILAQSWIDHKFPLILKKDKGTRADGVYLIQSVEVLQDLLLKDLDLLLKGFLLQEFIPSHANPEISNYYRINIVGNRAQSAVQFQLVWQQMDNCLASRLVDFPQAEQIPVDLSFFPENRLQEIVTACPYSQDVVGIDVMFKDGQMFLLEYNDGPAVGLVVDIGAKYLTASSIKEAANACHNFAKSNANRCLEIILRNAKEIQQFIENVRTNPRWGQDPNTIPFPEFDSNPNATESEDFLITSRVERDDDPHSLYYRVTFRDISLNEFRFQFTPIVSIKHGILKVSANGDMTILNENFEVAAREILPVNNDQSSAWLAYFRIQYQLQKFTDAEFRFEDGRLTFENGFELSQRKNAERSNIYAAASVAAVTAAVVMGSRYVAQNEF